MKKKYMNKTNNINNDELIKNTILQSGSILEYRTLNVVRESIMNSKAQEDSIATNSMIIDERENKNYEIDLLLKYKFLISSTNKLGKKIFAKNQNININLFFECKGNDPEGILLCSEDIMSSPVTIKQTIFFKNNRKEETPLIRLPFNVNGNNNVIFYNGHNQNSNKKFLSQTGNHGKSKFHTTKTQINRLIKLYREKYLLNIEQYINIPIIVINCPIHKYKPIYNKNSDSFSEIEVSKNIPWGIASNFNRQEDESNLYPYIFFVHIDYLDNFLFYFLNHPFSRKTISYPSDQISNFKFKI